MTSPWLDLATERRFVLTADQDWAPEWATRELVAWAAREQLPLHVFQTSPSTVLDEAAAAGLVTRGWHPNFVPGSTHGATPEEVVGHLNRMLSGVRSARSHAFSETFGALTALATAGIRFDSNFPSAFAGHLAPAVHASGIIRMPVWFEDDIWMRYFPDSADLGPLREVMAAPGLKILNVHPVHFALNSPSMRFYDAHRAELYRASDEPLPPCPCAGSRQVIERIVDVARAQGESWRSFEDVCDEASAVIDDSPSLSVRIAEKGDLTHEW